MKMMTTFLLISLLAFCFTSLAFGATNLPDSEVQALKDIASSLGKNNWNFNINPCSGKHNWVTPNAEQGKDNNVTCDCSFVNDNFTCHVVAILLKSQNLQGNLPWELVNLPYIREMYVILLLSLILMNQLINLSLFYSIHFLTFRMDSDLALNYLSGSIPKDWGSLIHLESM
ncbi:putative LRR receptor-like serine/threonine-protein kinase, partial [Mucuna pruriens]